MGTNAWRSAATALPVAAYLAMELWFNVLVVDVAAAPPAERTAALEWLEPLGRLLGGLGCTLLLARAFGGHARATFAAAALSFPLMWFGQQWLLESLVDASSPAERRHAYSAMLLSDGVRAGRVAMPGLEATGPDGVLLGVLFPLLASGSDLPEAVLRQLRPLVAAAAEQGCDAAGCRCAAAMQQQKGPGARLPSPAVLARCVVTPLHEAQNAAFRRYLDAHGSLTATCAGDLNDAPSCRLQREALERRLALGTLDPAQPLSRAAFDVRSGWERRASDALHQRFGLRATDVPPPCRAQLLPAPQHARVCLYEPLLERMVAKARRTIEAAPGDRDAAAAGREAYRAMIALPLALGFSLFFAIVNAAALAARAAAGLLGPRAIPVRAALQAAAIVAALTVPALLPRAAEPGAAERAALVARTEPGAQNRVLRQALLWVWRTEPVVWRLLRAEARPGAGAALPPEALRQAMIRLHQTMPLR